MWFRKRTAPVPLPQRSAWWYGLWHGGTCYPPPTLDDLEIFPSNQDAVDTLCQRYEECAGVDRTSTILLYDPQRFTCDLSGAFDLSQPLLRVRFSDTAACVIIGPA